MEAIVLSAPRSHAQDASATAPGIRTVHVSLDQRIVSLSGRVSNVDGTGLAGAKLTFAGFDTAAATANGGGDFALTLRTGPYSLAINETGYNNRTCTVYVGVTPTGQGALNSTLPVNCFTLLHDGMAMLSGSLRDAPSHVAASRCRRAARSR
jgi:hypothetical protein